MKYKTTVPFHRSIAVTILFLKMNKRSSLSDKIKWLQITVSFK